MVTACRSVGASRSPPVVMVRVDADGLRPGVAGHVAVADQDQTARLAGSSTSKP